MTSRVIDVPYWAAVAQEAERVVHKPEGSTHGSSSLLSLVSWGNVGFLIAPDGCANNVVCVMK